MKVSRTMASRGRKPPEKPSAARALVRGLTPPARLILLLPLLLAGCELKSGQPNPNDKPKRPDQVLDFQVLYAQNCSGCHGAEGDFGPAPPLNDKLFLAIISDIELKRVVTGGREKMPAFAKSHGGNLTPAQVQVLMTGLRVAWGRQPMVAAPVPAYLESDGRRKGAKPGNKGNGAETFLMACAGCHGDNGKGGKDAGPLNDWAFLALISDQALRRIIITGRPDLGMPDYADKEDRGPKFKPLTDQDVADLVALLASWRKTTLFSDGSQKRSTGNASAKRR